jgi:antitoxin component YwqK of YwqJK toxin-antitoxin module
MQPYRIYVTVAGGDMRPLYYYEKVEDERHMKIRMIMLVLMLAFSCSYGFGEQDGPVKTYYENGKLEVEGTWENGKLEGPAKTYYESGGLKSEENYKNSKLDGQYKKYYKNGQLEKEATYSDGLLQGLTKKYYKGGQLEGEGYYKNGELYGPYKTYYVSGQLKSEGSNKDGKAEGPNKTYYESGQLSSFGVLKNGQLEGATKAYYENGKLQEEAYYENGKLEGPQKEYYDNGNLKSESFYKNGLKDGDIKLYYPTGKLRGIAKFSEGLDGTAIMYDENGNVMREFTHKDTISSDIKKQVNEHLENDEYKEAMGCIEKAISGNPNCFKALDYEGFGCWFNMQRQDQYARFCYEKAISLNPQDSQSCYGLGGIYDRLGKYPQAIKYYEKGNDVDPNSVYLQSAVSYASLGFLYAKMGQYARGQKNFLKAKEQYAKLSQSGSQSVMDCSAAAQEMERMSNDENLRAYIELNKNQANSKMDSSEEKNHNQRRRMLEVELGKIKMNVYKGLKRYAEENR